MTTKSCNHKDSKYLTLVLKHPLDELPVYKLPALFKSKNSSLKKTFWVVCTSFSKITTRNQNQDSFDYYDSCPCYIFRYIVKPEMDNPKLSIGIMWQHAFLRHLDKYII